MNEFANVLVLALVQEGAVPQALQGVRQHLLLQMLPAAIFLLTHLLGDLLADVLILVQEPLISDLLVVLLLNRSGFGQDKLNSVLLGILQEDGLAVLRVEF